jgi:hypothetical protein
LAEKINYRVRDGLDRFIGRELKKIEKKIPKPEPVRQMLRDFARDVISGKTAVAGYKIRKEEHAPYETYSGKTQQQEPDLYFEPEWTTQDALAGLGVGSGIYVRLHHYSYGSGNNEHHYATALIKVGDADCRNEYENDELHLFLGFLDAFPGIVQRFPEMIEHCKELENQEGAKAEKRKKIDELRTSSLDAWVAQVCAGLEYPYSVDKMATKFDLCILIENNLQIRIAIPKNKFQEILPTLPELIKTYEDLIKTQKAVVFVEREGGKRRWKMNAKKA